MFAASLNTNAGYPLACNLATSLDAVSLELNASTCTTNPFNGDPLFTALFGTSLFGAADGGTFAGGAAATGADFFGSTGGGAFGSAGGVAFGSTRELAAGFLSPADAGSSAGGAGGW